MKLDNKIFICALLALILLLFIGATSASDTLEDNLATNATGDEVISVSEAEDALSEGNTIIVDGGGDGKISAAVSSANGGDTIYIKNGEYTESNTITFTKSLTITGESQDGVRITGAAKSLFSAVEPAMDLSFNNLTILNAGGSSNAALKLTYSGHSLNVVNCTFDNCGSKYGTMQLGHPGTALIDNCKILNSKETTSAGSGAIYVSGAGTFTIRNTIIDNVQYTVASSYMNGAIYVYNAGAVLNIENTVISNVTAPTRGIINTVGTVNIKGSKFMDSTLSQFSTSITNHLIYIGDKGSVNLEQTEISGNTCVDELFNNYKDTSKLKVNHCNIHDNSASGTVNSLGTIDLEANYWGSNDLPSGVSASTWIVNNNGVYEYNNGDALDVVIPGLSDGGDEPVADGTIYVSTAGDDANTGLTKDTAVKTIAKAIEIAENGKIVILAGTYTLDATLTVAKDMAITGQGEVIIDGNSARILENTANLNLTNIAFTNGKAAFASAILDDGNMIITNCVFYSNSATGNSGNAINNRKGSMVIDNSKFYENKASRGVIGSQSGTNLLVNNSEFYNNDMTSISTTYGMIYSNSADTIVENTVFRNNKAKSGGAIYTTRATSSTTGTLEVTNCTFDNNTAYQGPGGAIFAGRTPTTIKDSTFTNNQATNGEYVKGQGGAIYQTLDDPKSAMTIDNCIFINNTAGDLGAAIFINTNQGTFDIANSVIINKEGDDNYAIDKKDGATTVITADNNYWGNNTKVNFNLDEDSEIALDVSVIVDDESTGAVTITAKFSKDLPDGIELTFSTDSGSLDKTVSNDNAGVTVKGTVGETDKDVLVSINGIPQFRVALGEILDVIYVSPQGKDTNDGSLETPVATIARALELAKKGQIVVLEGTYKVNDLGTISSDLNITGNGTVIIDAQNNNRVLYVGTDANVILKNLIFINGYTSDVSGALLGNANELTLINCTLANSSAGINNGGAIYNVGKLTIINSTIANNTAREGGAIFTNDALAKGASIVIDNSVFENNIATGNDNLGGGAIFTQQIAEFRITNTTFRDNEAQTKSSGGAIFISHSTATITITDSKFISNFAKGQSNVGGGAIYMAGASNYERKGTLDITNTLFDSNIAGYDGGAIYVRATTLKIANSVLINNADQNGYAIFGYGTEQVNPSITANDNWWGSNDNPKDNIGGYRFTPSVARWAIMTIANASEIKAGENVLLTVSINNYTTGSANGTLANPIKVALPVTIKTTSGDIEGVLENGEFTTNYAVPEGLKYISATLNDETVVLYVVPTVTIVEINDITAKQGERVTFEITVVTNDGTIVNSGHIELYIGDNLMANIAVINGTASDKFMIVNAEGIYNLTAKFVDDSLLFTESNDTAVLNVSGIYNIVTKDNFFEFFGDNGVISSDLPFNELIFQGEFKDLGINVITLNKPISIVGDEAVLNNIAISALGNDIKLTNITLNANVDFMNNAGAAIFVMGSNSALDNVVVNYTVPDDTEGFGIYAYEADGFTLTNSKIIFDGNNLNGDVKNHALRIWECDDVVVKGNLINATLPSVNCDWSAWGSMDTDLVLAVGIQNGENILFTENQVFSNVKAAASGYPTLDTIIVYGSTDIVISHNNITENDFTGQGIPGYSYCVDLYSFNGATVEYNNIYVKTSTGIEGAGTAYCVQATGPYTGFVVDHNNITAIGAGPALGIYSQNYNGQTDIIVTNNYINVTGLATGSYYALVSGMELQDTVAKVYNNTIYSYNVGTGTSGLFGISYAQSTSGNHYFDIQNNTVITEGAYAVYLKSAKDSTIKNNILYADDLVGDEAAMIGGGSGNVIENNYPIVCNNITVVATDVFEGQATTVTVTVPDATGSVTIRVNNKEYTVDLIDGVAVKEIEDYGDDFNVEVTYNGDLKYLPNTNSTTFKKLDNIVTPDEFYAYFEADGSLKSTMPYAELIFNGTFEDFPYIVIKKSVTLKGGDSVFYNFGIVVKASDVTVDNFTISITVDEDDAIVISAVNVDDVTITNNNLYLESHITDDTFDANAINLDRVSGATVLNNTIYTSLPALYASNYDMENFMMGLNTVNPVRIRNCEDVKFKDNDVESYVNDVSASYPTIQCLFVVGSKNVLIDSNNFTMDDEVSPLGTPVYLYAINFGYDEKTTISNNNFYISTLSGQDSAGTAYAIQGVESELDIIGNNITTISNGPNLGIYVASMMGGSSELYIEGNIINVTGYAVSSAQWALVSGIEMTNGNAKIYNNTIYTNNKAGYVEIAPVHGISYGQYMYGSRSIDAQDNTIYTEGKYTVSFLDPSGMSITNNYLIAHDLKGDDSVLGAEIVKDNLPAKANLTVTVEDITVGEVAVIKITLDERAINNVTVLVNGKYYDVEINEGKGQIEISDLSVGEYAVVATFAGDYYVIEDENSTTFNVDKIASELTITIGDIVVGEDVNVTISVPGVAGEVTVYVDGAKMVLPLTDGNATYTIPSISAGDHSVTAVYLGDKTHSIATNTTKFTVEKLATTIEVPSIEINAGETAEFDIVLSANATGNVLVKIGDKTAYAAIKDGIAHVSISGLPIGVYNISAIYTGDDFYGEAESNSSTVTVNALDCGLSANATNIVVGEDAAINIEINKEITEGVKVVLGENEYPAVLTDGKAIVYIPNLANGTYTATVIFAGNEKFAAKEVEVTFTVGKKEIPGDINITMDIPEGTTSPEFTVNLPADATGNFTVTVDGKDYTAPVVNGSATVKVPDLTVGNHTISSSYSGDDNYGGFTSDNQTIDIPKATIPGGDSVLDPTTPEGSDSPSYTISLPADATGNLTVTVDGVNYTAPLVNGTATVTVPKLAPGDHNITVTYTGDGKYSSISKNTKYNVKEKADDVKLVKPKDITMLYTAKTPYKVRVMVNGKAVGAGQVVTIKFNGQTYNVKTDKNGYATLKLPDVKPQKAVYTITAEYKGVKVTNKVKVNSVIKAKKAKVKKSKKVNKIKVTLKKVNGKALKGKKLKLKINGKKVKAKTNKKGKAVFKLKKKVVKKLEVGKKYKYTVTFGKDTVTKKLKVKK
ncbi:Ig-like domain repeat protein [Methanobrevibacter sp.]|uniref:Ig-like domain repeat protein n=1 Tax=Methanobrevibacter sp. TaxID=66852 RepID=UPI0025FF49CF|nr:Ig-like domain repeat protein [Methanobrevibacter sp.]MBR4448363.1 Ig-like domain repeat protein [Methanobrevibacter sp.]